MRMPAYIHDRPGESPGSSAGARGATLQWQRKYRLLGALFFGSAELALTPDGASASAVTGIGILISLYVVVLALISAILRRSKGASTRLSAFAALADIAFIFGMAAVAMAPENYVHALIYCLLVLVITEYYFGSFLTYGALATIALSYMVLCANAVSRGWLPSMNRELWTMSTYSVVAVVYIHLYGSWRRRLERLAWLFGRVEEGDFSEGYDVKADEHPDSITMLGRAYNRVHAQLGTMVLTDAMSGCLNRLGLEQELQRTLERAAIHSHDIALLVVDVDKFKLINDTFGHLVGDGVIREVGQILRDIVRSGDIVSRVGGDEFVLLLPETSATAAFKIASRISDAVAWHRFAAVRGKVSITVSVGLVSDRVPDSNIAHDLHSRADEALYAAKGAGRNRVAVWTPNLRTLAVARAREAVLD